MNIFSGITVIFTPDKELMVKTYINIMYILCFYHYLEIEKFGKVLKNVMQPIHFNPLCSKSIYIHTYEQLRHSLVSDSASPKPE